MSEAHINTQVRAILNGGDVRRFHTYRMLRENTVAQHSFYVAWWCALIWEMKPSANLLLAAMQHDLGEYHVGDMPSFTKISLPAAAQSIHNMEDAVLRLSYLPPLKLIYEEEITLKAADKLDSAAFGAVDYRLGNANALSIVHKDCEKAIKLSLSMNIDTKRPKIVSWIAASIADITTIDKEHPEDENRS